MTTHTIYSDNKEATKMPKTTTTAAEKKNHICSDVSYRCQFNDDDGNLCCSVLGVILETGGKAEICPVCGGVSPVVQTLQDGREIRRCGDASWPIGHTCNMPDPSDCNVAKHIK